MTTSFLHDQSMLPPSVSWSNDDISMLTLTAQGAGTVTSPDIINFAGFGANIVVDITAITGTTPTCTVTIQGKDVASGKYYTILTSAALAAVATTLLTIFPNAPNTANVSANALLPRTFRVSVTVGGTSPSVTATFGASVVN